MVVEVVAAAAAAVLVVVVLVVAAAAAMVVVVESRAGRERTGPCCSQPLHHYNVDTASCIAAR